MKQIQNFPSQDFDAKAQRSSSQGVTVHAVSVEESAKQPAVKIVHPLAQVPMKTL